MPPTTKVKKVKVDPKSKLGKNIKKDRLKIKQTTQDRLDEAEGKKKGKMKFKVVKKAEKAPVKKAPKKIKFVVDVDPEADTGRKTFKTETQNKTGTQNKTETEKFMEEVREDNKPGGKVSNLISNANYGYLSYDDRPTPSQLKEKDRKKFKTKLGKIIKATEGKNFKFNAQQKSVSSLVLNALNNKAVPLDTIKKMYKDYMSDMEHRFD